jgi:hypothetical protein
LLLLAGPPDSPETSVGHSILPHHLLGPSAAIAANGESTGVGRQNRSKVIVKVTRRIRTVDSHVGKLQQNRSQPNIERSLGQPVYSSARELQTPMEGLHTFGRYSVCCPFRTSADVWRGTWPGPGQAICRG